ncbi:HEXXH motif-containing putative peptide modification protein [Streptomyces luteireticuli]|uniref:aKG-HExxH-type peptide beta-hydroxylase n=1 Tax=Streptomyces luteireticuli TaxID=173858 RepID=UPI0035588F4E
MHGDPDRDEALDDQSAIFRVVDALLARQGGGILCEQSGMGLRDRVRWTYPGRVAAAFAVQRLGREAAADAEASALVRTAEAQAAGCAARGATPDWPVDLASPYPHLVDSIRRAVRQLPDPDRTSRPALWEESDRAVFRAAAGLLGAYWPAMRDELAVTVRQIALLSGPGINGYTDFTVHGAIFVSRARLTDADGLPAHVRLAESLVHEGTHTRCNAAAAREPFLLDGEDVARLRVATPLRADARPLAGLFQQLVVLVRCTRLYDRVRDVPGLDDNAVRRRRERLAAQSRQAADALESHRSLLSPHGTAVLDALS